MIKNGHFGDMFSSNSLQSIRLFVGDICYKVCFSSCLNINITSTWKSRFILLIKWDGKKHDEDIKDIKISRCLYPKQLVRTIGWVRIKISRCLYPKQLVRTIGWVKIKISRCLYPKQLVGTIGWVKMLCLKSVTFDLSEIQFENYSYLPRKHFITTCLSYEMVKCENLISLSCSIIFDVFFSALVRQQAYRVW